MSDITSTDDQIFGLVKQVLFDHDSDRMECLDHDGRCCPSGDAHDFESHYAHQADVLVHLFRALETNAVQRSLKAVADEWQWSAWADSPRREDRVQERLATAQYVTDWLRAHVSNNPF